ARTAESVAARMPERFRVGMTRAMRMAAPGAAADYTSDLEVLEDERHPEGLEGHGVGHGRGGVGQARRRIVDEDDRAHELRRLAQVPAQPADALERVGHEVVLAVALLGDHHGHEISARIASEEVDRAHTGRVPAADRGAGLVAVDAEARLEQLG